MCIILYKPKTVKIPTIDVLENCWESNPHGAGLAWTHNKETIILKGFMEFETFIDTFEKLKLTEKDEVVIHFRISTHGIVCPENTHPFIISDDINEVKSTYKTTSKPILAHNGILSNIPRTKDISDTMEFILQNNKIINPLLLNQAKGNKFALIQNGAVSLHGQWIFENGIYYSNSGYQEYFNKNYFDSYWKKEGSIFNGKQECPCCHNELYQEYYCWECDKDIYEMEEMEGIENE